MMFSCIKNFNMLVVNSNLYIIHTQVVGQVTYYKDLMCKFICSRCLDTFWDM